MKIHDLMNEIENLVKPSIEELGYELYHVEYVKESGEYYLRIYIDSNEGISLQDCEAVSRRISDLLDEQDPIKEHYYLEISSPGINRYLYTSKHYEDNISNKVKVRLLSPVNSKKTLEGVLKAVNEGEILLAVDSDEVIIPREKIKSINVEVDF